MKLKIWLFLTIFSLAALPVAAEVNLAQKLSGKILLQVQSAGQAWYVNPTDGRRYFLGSPADALAVMRRLGLGINEANFNKLPADKNLVNRLKGKIILRIQSSGQAYYINPADGQKYYLGRPTDAFNIMKQLALGITNADLAQIPTGQLALPKTTIPSPTPSTTETPTSSQTSVLSQAAEAIRNNNSENTQLFFTANLQKAVAYTMSALSADSRLLFANILSGATLTGQTDTEKIYSTTAYFSLGGYNVPLNFHVKKQPDGFWLIANL